MKKSTTFLLLLLLSLSIAAQEARQGAYVGLLTQSFDGFEANPKPAFGIWVRNRVNDSPVILHCEVNFQRTKLSGEDYSLKGWTFGGTISGGYEFGRGAVRPAIRAGFLLTNFFGSKTNVDNTFDFAPMLGIGTLIHHAAVELRAFKGVDYMPEGKKRWGIEAVVAYGFW